MKPHTPLGHPWEVMPGALCVQAPQHGHDACGVSAPRRATATPAQVVVRHGERLDEADSGAWRRLRTGATRNDPPLTERGHEQARGAGAQVARLLADLVGEAPVAVYSSPTARTMYAAGHFPQLII